jgi:hypothetical protein
VIRVPVCPVHGPVHGPVRVSLLPSVFLNRNPVKRHRARLGSRDTRDTRTRYLPTSDLPVLPSYVILPSHM